MIKSNHQRILHANGKQLDLSSPRIMGIINVTPDSFHEKSRVSNRDALLEKVDGMIRAGADIIDVGAMSTRPGAEIISVEEESARLLPALKAIRDQFPEIWLSVDTFRADIVRAAADIGADIINDISGAKFDEELITSIGETGLPYILMYMPGAVENMHEKPVKGNIIRDASIYFHEKISFLHDKGIWDIILDPGFGFGKTLNENYLLIEHLDHFDFLGLPYLIGISRKSMVQKVVGKGADGALNGTTALHMIALQKGASILRVHDVAEAQEVIAIHRQLRSAAES